MNTLKDLEKEILDLEQSKKEIDEKISAISKKIVVLKNSEKFLNIKTNEANKELFAFYLMENKNLADRTVHNYFNALQRVKDLFFEVLEVILSTELYFIDDIKIFELIITIFNDNEAMQKECKKRHNDLSAAINNYYKFLLTLKEIK